MPVNLDQIVPWGRVREEYELMFDLATADLSSGVLDCGGGPASFVAELHAAGVRSVSVDPIYAYSAAEIRARFDTIFDVVLPQVRSSPDAWVWTYHRDAEGLGNCRRKALEKFLADYSEGLRQNRYIAGELPEIPFADGAFGLAVCSHLLFLYSHVLPEDFHIRSALELCRVAREVRFFPLLPMRREFSSHLVAVRNALDTAGFRSEIVPVKYEFIPGGNQMLRAFRG